MKKKSFIIAILVFLATLPLFSQTGRPRDGQALFRELNYGSTNFNSLNQKENAYYTYNLWYSEAVNLIQSGEYGLAASYGRKMIQINKMRPEAYKIMGDIHLFENLCSLAIQFYLQSKKHTHDFILELDMLSLLEGMASCYLQINQDGKAIDTLKEITEFTGSLSTKQIHQKIGRAHFSLGKIYREKEDWVNSLISFIEAAKKDYKKKLAYLLLAYYYVENDEEKIAMNNMNHHKREVKNENRISSFLYYKKLHDRTISDEDYNREIESEEYKRIFARVMSFERKIKNEKLQEQIIYEPL